MKTKNLHRNLHPIHWHGSMYVAIAAILLTSIKCSSEMLRALQAVPVHADTMSSIFLRSAENVHSPITISLARKVVVAGR